MHATELLKALNPSLQPWVRLDDAKIPKARVPCGAEVAQVGCMTPVLLLGDEGRAEGPWRSVGCRDAAPAAALPPQTYGQALTERATSHWDAAAIGSSRLQGRGKPAILHCKAKMAIVDCPCSHVFLILYQNEYGYVLV